MKRKLNAQDVPEEVPATHGAGEAAAAPKQQDEAPASFTDFGLDPRLLQAIARLGFTRPTPIQAKQIPLASRGKDVLARAKTGTGKTAAYLLPLLNSTLKRKSDSSRPQVTSSLILVPTKELASQVHKSISALSFFCAKDVQVVNLTGQMPEQAQRALLSSSPDIVVATPARAVQHLATSTLEADHLEHLVIDEADVVLSYTESDDFPNIVKLIPKGIQTSLASATLTTDVDTLKGLLCRDPAILDLQNEETDDKSISQFVVKCGEDEKFLILFAVFKLKLVRGKCIVFVGDVDRCYRVKLFLEQFGIKSCVLNSELPVNCRIHVVEEFNKGVYDIIVATDETEVVGGDESSGRATKPKSDDKTEETEAPKVSGDADAKKTQSPANKKPKKSKSDKEFGISRGIDFQSVACVLNFDLPLSAKSYTHRIGRTARAGRSGIALSLVIPKSEYRKEKRTSFPTTQHDEAVLGAITASQSKKGQRIVPYQFDMEKLDGFRYRVGSALKAVSLGAIRQARLAELRQELLKSEKLKRHLEENPEDLRYLRHDNELRAARVQPHLKHVPDYLLPAGKASGDVGQPLGEVGFVGPGRTGKNRIRQARERNKMKGKKGKANPLKSFKARPKKSM